MSEIHGLAWQKTTCVSMRRGWLLIPIVLTTVTVPLAIWTIATNWRQRHSTPVWKDSILPLIFYGRDVVDDALDTHTHQNEEHTSQEDDGDHVSEKSFLLETKKVETISNSTAVSLWWLYSTDKSADSTSIDARTLSRTKQIWQSRNHGKDTSNTRLPETHQDAGKHAGMHHDAVTHAETCEDQAAHGNAETHDDIHAHGDADTQDMAQTHTTA